ncbi:MAG: hypothetical protein ABIM89_02820 [Mycobacteriales bacterium]
MTWVENGVTFNANVCIPGDTPCAARLDWPAASVARTPNTVVATARDRRHVAILQARTLSRLYEHHAGRGRITALVARDSDRILLLDDSGELTLLDPTPVLPQQGPDIALGISSVVYHGQQPVLEFDRSGPQTGLRSVLIIPMLEPGQGFNGNTDDYRQYYQFADILERVRGFYEETTHDGPDNEGLALQFSWFGADTPTLYTGAPLMLPKPWKDYWGPAWDPGAISGRVALPGAGLVLSFSGDETLQVNASPGPAGTYDAEVFDIRFTAANYRRRIPDGFPTLSFSAAMAPSRSIAIDGTDRNGNAFSISVDTGALAGSTAVDLVRSSLSDGSAQAALADVIEEMLASAPGAGGLFERPSVVWHDDRDEAGMLHVSLSFAAGGGSAPAVTSFDLDDLLSELGSGSRPATFAIPGDEGALESYLSRNIADAWVGRHPELAGDLRDNYFDLVERTPSATIEGAEMTVRINLSTHHGGFGATIELESQSGLEPIGMDDPQSHVGADTSFSGGGGPKFQDLGLFADVYTALIDATIEIWGDEEGAIDELNLFFNGVSPQGDLGWTHGPFHSFVVTPAFPTLGNVTSEPDVAELRGAARSVEYADRRAQERAKPVLPIGADRSSIVMHVAPDSADAPTRSTSSAATLAHELGHSLLALPDLYEGGDYRSLVGYIGGHCIMGDSSSFAHFCAYNQRIKGWLADDAILLIDRPAGNDMIDREVVLVQLEHWDPLLDDAARADLAQSLLSGMLDGTPVVAAVFLRLGGDGRQFDIVELRGPGVGYSLGITPPRLLVTNAIDPEDDTRYAETEVEGAGTTAGVLERYRRKVHLLSSDLRNEPGAPTSFDFASEQVFAEVGLSIEVLEWATGSIGSADVDVARIAVRWSRGPAIDVGFVDSTPAWRSPDIAILKPEEIATDGSYTFPEDQDTESNETFRVPTANEDPLPYKVAVRVWNFGDAQALNVQVQLVLRRPGGGGDWDDSVIGSEVVDTLDGGDSTALVDFDWPVSSDLEAHVCFFAQIGDRDVPRDDQGNALASDDTNEQNNWAQQNVDIYTAAADSPPDPVELIYQVNNGGSYMEEVRLVPRGLGAGARLTVTPARLRIAPRSRGLFRVRVDLDEALLDARCGKDVSFLLETWRVDDHSEQRWGAVKYVVKPRRRTTTTLLGGLMPERLHLVGHVSPDVGAQRILLHIQRPGQPSLWEELTLGPASTFDYELLEAFAPGQEVRATARFDGTREFAASVSATLSWVWHPEG